MDTQKKELYLYRRLLIISSGFYLSWWFAVQAFIKGAFNPLASRLVVVGSMLIVWGLSYISEDVRKNIRNLFLLCAWFITLHYYYLFNYNAADTNWVIGAYVTVLAVSLCIFSPRALFFYSIFVILMSLALIVLNPSLEFSVFLPGLLTILFQANTSLRVRLKTLDDLETSNALFQTLFNSTFEGIFVYRDFKILKANDSLANMFGYSRTDLMGMNPLDLVIDDHKAMVSEKIKENSDIPYEVKGVKKGGAIIDIEVRGKNFLYQHKPARLVTMQDISDRRQAELERIQKRAMEESVRVRDDFISIASHELKTPLTSLKLQAQLMTRGIAKKSPEVFAPEKLTGFIGLVNRQVNRLVSLVESMLDVSRIATGQLHLQKENVDLSQLIQEAVELLRLYQGKPGPVITIDVPAPLVINADRNRVEQVIENLLTNAIKYGDGKPVSVKARVEGSHVLLSVEDRGLGIAPENQNRIFNRFERAVPAQEISGFGLGLFIVRQIMEAHGGKILVESKLGVGSTFTAQFNSLNL